MVKKYKLPVFVREFFSQKRENEFIQLFTGKFKFDRKEIKVERMGTENYESKAEKIICSYYRCKKAIGSATDDIITHINEEHLNDIDWPQPLQTIKMAPINTCVLCVSCNDMPSQFDRYFCMAEERKIPMNDDGTVPIPDWCPLDNSSPNYTKRIAPGWVEEDE